MLATAPTRWLKLSALVPGKNPRGTKFTVDDLVESFGHAPVLHNVVVRALPGGRGTFEIVAGHRRVAAARKKGLAQIEAKIIEVDDLTAEQLALEENVRRRALPDEPTALARLLEIYEQQRPTKRGGDRHSKRFRSNRQAADLKSGAAKVAALTGQSERDVRRKIKIGQLAIPKVKRALTENRIGILDAEKLARLPPRTQSQQLAELVRHKSESRSETWRIADALGYAAEHLGRLMPGSLDNATAVKLSGLTTSVTDALRRAARVARSSRSSKMKKSVAKPKGAVAGAVSFDAKSFNRKLSAVGFEPSAGDRPRPVAMKPFVSSTSVSIRTTCPNTCPFKSTPGTIGGCYADAGFTRIKIRKLDEAAEGFSATDVIREEVRQIDSSFRGGDIPQDGARGGRDLRLHIAGEATTAEHAKLLGGAATRWKQRKGGDVWTFTHGWREIPRSAWGPDVSVIASVENPRDMLLAKKRGYASAIVVEDFPNGDKAFKLPGVGKTKVVPCPAETRGVPCISCRLCLVPDQLLKARSAIAFKIHGQHAGRALEALK